VANDALVRPGIAEFRRGDRRCGIHPTMPAKERADVLGQDGVEIAVRHQDVVDAADGGLRDDHSVPGAELPGLLDEHRPPWSLRGAHMVADARRGGNPETLGGPRTACPVNVRAQPSQPGRTRPDSYAITTSWARSRARSLPIARLTCVFAVAGLTTKR